jgi:hypothetical protein
MSYTIKLYDTVFYIRREGVISPEERIESYTDLVNYSYNNKKHFFIIDNRLADLTKVNVNQNLAALDIFKEIERKIGEPTKFVILVRRKIEYAIARQFEILLSIEDNFYSEVRIYYKSQAAINFLEKEIGHPLQDDLIEELRKSP